MSFTLCSVDNAPEANSTLQRFDARYFHLNFPISAVSTIISNSNNRLEVNSEFRSNRDLVGLLWTSEDIYGHPYFMYTNNINYNGLKVVFVANPHNLYEFSLTLTDSNSNEYIYRLYPYKISSDYFIPDTSESSKYGRGPGLSFLTSDFYSNLPTVEDGYRFYIIDFDNMRTGYNYDGNIIDSTNIKKLFFSISSESYGLGSSATLLNVGNIQYYQDSYVKIGETESVDYWKINNSLNNIVLTSGDIINLSVVIPDDFIETIAGDEEEEYSSYDIYTFRSETISVVVSDYYIDDDIIYVKNTDSSYNDVAIIGGNVTANNLQMDTAIGSESYTFIMHDIQLSGVNKTVSLRYYPQDAHSMKISSGYDDTYSITPWRQIYTIYNLGYRDIINMYMGMAHYFKASSVMIDGIFTNKILINEEYPINYPTQRWCESFFSIMSEYNYSLIFSLSYEILNSYMPDDWKQRDYAGNEALTGWNPPSTFIIPTKLDCCDYIARAIIQGIELLSQLDDIIPMFQIGEPWWWDGSYTNGSPCIYDDYTKTLYASETGNDVPTPYYTNYKQEVNDEQRSYLEWIGEKLGQSTDYIRNTVKKSFPNSLSTLLFFSPQVMNPASDLLEIINFPKSHWIYPQYDFMQIEDYDWIIDGSMDLLSLTLTAAIEELNYPINVVHYFVGYVNYSYQTWIWNNINTATSFAIQNEITNIYIWAYPQVIRDGVLYTDNITEGSAIMSKSIVNLPPKNQYSLIEPFSKDNWENINQVFKMLFPDNQSLSSELSDPSGIVPTGEYFSISFTSDYVTVSSGVCIINGVLIEITSMKSLPVNNLLDGYILSSHGDTLPVNIGVGPYYVYIVMYYNPSDKVDAYISLVYSQTVFENYRKYICVLGIAVCYYRSSNLTVEEFLLMHPESSESREYLPGYLDGGVLLDANEPVIKSSNWVDL